MSVLLACAGADAKEERPRSPASIDATDPVAVVTAFNEAVEARDRQAAIDLSASRTELWRALDVDWSHEDVVDIWFDKFHAEGNFEGERGGPLSFVIAGPNNRARWSETSATIDIVFANDLGQVFKFVWPLQKRDDEWAVLVDCPGVGAGCP